MRIKNLCKHRNLLCYPRIEAREPFCLRQSQAAFIPPTLSAFSGRQGVLALPSKGRTLVPAEHRAAGTVSPAPLMCSQATSLAYLHQCRRKSRERKEYRQGLPCSWSLWHSETSACLFQGKMSTGLWAQLHVHLCLLTTPQHTSQHPRPSSQRGVTEW